MDTDTEMAPTNNVNCVDEYMQRAVQQLKPLRSFSRRNVTRALLGLIGYKAKQGKTLPGEGTPSGVAKEIIRKWVEAGLVERVTKHAELGNQRMVHRWVKRDHVPDTPEVQRLFQIMGLNICDFEKLDDQKTPMGHTMQDVLEDSKLDDQETPMVHIMQDVLEDPTELKNVGQGVKPPRNFFRYCEVRRHLKTTKASAKSPTAMKIIEVLMKVGLVVRVTQDRRTGVVRGIKRNGRDLPVRGIKLRWVRKTDIPDTPEVRKLLRTMSLSTQDFEDQHVQNTQIDSVAHDVTHDFEDQNV